MKSPTETWRVPAGLNQRLDVHVADHLGEPRNQVQRWIRSAAVTVDGQKVKPSFAITGGESIELHRPPPDSGRVDPEPGALDVLHEDEHLIVVDKSAGIAVHPGAGRSSGTLVHHLLHRYPEIAGVGGDGRPGIVHRLDMGTSGVMVVARTQAAYLALSEAFQKRRVGKKYLGICEGQPGPASGTMQWPVARDRWNRKRMRTAREGRPAETRYRVLATARRSSLLQLELLTGRTHQIRVHLKTLGHPLLGDEVYGRDVPRDWPLELRQAVEQIQRPALHAWRLEFPHPATGESVAFTASPASDLTRLWKDLGGATDVLEGGPD